MKRIRFFLLVLGLIFAFQSITYDSYASVIPAVTDPPVPPLPPPPPPPPPTK